ncbi:hypothetical protein [Carboxylicivirga sp. N1Y90]|uniref:hypothetical protein n=1 Tax=Carboxylicivirga fragile TaxID=3417571 RepID=UPI003D343642|nr:hypothetical protein [Marinilabiliaceae bacterium N1Y90]
MSDILWLVSCVLFLLLLNQVLVAFTRFMSKAPDSRTSLIYQSAKLNEFNSMKEYFLKEDYLEKYFTRLRNSCFGH